VTGDQAGTQMRHDSMARTQNILEEERPIVVIPTYNERENIRRLIPQVLGQHPQIDILVVDDNSPDGTGQVVQEFAGATPRVRLMQRDRKLGLGTAYIAGFRFAIENKYSFILEMDADFSHAPGEIPAFLHAIQGCDMVIGSRYMQGGATSNWPRRRRWLSVAANLYTRLLTGMSLTDATGGYRCFRREVLEKINVHRVGSNGYVFQIEMAFRVWRQGFRIVEIPIVFANRTEGQSKLDGHIVWEALWTLCKLRVLAAAGRLQRP